jgi:hypothetical protein
VLPLSVGTAAAQPADEYAQIIFQAGRSAFEAKDYSRALESFEAALAAGLSGPAVHFNIGVAAYRAGRHARAETAFRQVARTEAMRALAHYNLGLVTLAQGRREAAANWFSQAGQETTDERLRALVDAQLAELQVEVPERNWLAYGALEAGYDDNVALVSDSEVLGVSGSEDSFAELRLALGGPLDRSWRFEGDFDWLDYHDFDAFDQMSVSGGARYRASAGAWTHELGLQVEYSTLDGDGFENKRVLRLQARRPLTAAWQLRTRYRFSDIDGLGQFRGLDGRRHDLGVRAQWQREPWDFSIDYHFESSDYADETLSVGRQQLGFDLQRSLPGRWAVAAQVAWRHSSYELGSGEENRAELAIELSRGLSERWRISLRYAYTDNSASDPYFDYQRSRFSACLEAVM